MPYFGSSPHFGDFPTAQLTGNGGSVYSLPFKLPNENTALVFLNGAPQLPGVHFTIAEDALTFAENVAAGVQIYVHGLGIGKALIAPSAGSVGLAQLMAEVYASTAEAQGWASTTKLLSPAGLSNALKGSNQALSANGYQKLPGGLIIQWGGASNSPSPGTDVTVNLSVFFPNSLRSISVTPFTTSSSSPISSWVTDADLSSFKMRANVANVGVTYIAIGY